MSDLLLIQVRKLRVTVWWQMPHMQVNLARCAWEGALKPRCPSVLQL